MYKDPRFFLSDGKKILDAPPKVKGKWIEFVCTDYATRERRTRILIDSDDISCVKENYDVDEYQNDRWCNVFLKGREESISVLSSYDSLVKLLVSLKEAK